ncbi:ankyrin [Aspergillus sclerotioniger CBS 115572]|uniref:Ankyrin n=1 Tax=Aspergillus sclerotioniger CBS 115572 TaxID=1450535 RepID=A0A317UXR8_9EURO|nr:ankyrin [Aspergillus sclerotioniger CBS 115572]PWY66386.1 ankyrin [Aspergillus sclerotioniger CBS 115572]
MTALTLPYELIEQIVDLLEYESEINAFARSHPILYHTVNPMLYKHNVRYEESSALGWGIMHGPLTTVQQSLEAGASADKCDPEMKWRPMALAVIQGNEAIVRCLYEQGVNIRHTWGWRNPHHCHYCKSPGSLLLLAARHGQEGLARCFMEHLPRPYHPVLAHGAEVSPAPGHMHVRRPLFEAIDQGSEAMVSWLLRAGADPNDRSRWFNSVDDSALKHSLPFEGIFRCLLAAGADPTAVDGRGDSLTAIILASGQTAAVQMLIDQGFDLSRSLTRYNLLHQAIRGGRRVLDLLIGTGKWDTFLLPDHLDRSGCEQALGVAASTGKAQIVQWLLDRGFPVRAQSPSAVNLLANVACAEAEDADVAATIDFLLQYGLDIDESTSYGTTLERVASHYGFYGEPSAGRERIRMLLNRGADLLPLDSLRESMRYNSPEPLSANLVGRHIGLDEMIFQELEARLKPWTAVERLFRSAEHSAREREHWQWVKMARQYSWRVRYPAYQKDISSAMARQKQASTG